MSRYLQASPRVLICSPARAFGTSVISGQWQTYHWIYWLGPTMGAILATVFYLFLKSVHYW